MSPRSHANAQLVHALKLVPATVHLGPYDVLQHCFTDCAVEARSKMSSQSAQTVSKRESLNGPEVEKIPKLNKAAFWDDLMANKTS